MKRVLALALLVQAGLSMVGECDPQNECCMMGSGECTAATYRAVEGFALGRTRVAADAKTRVEAEVADAAAAKLKGDAKNTAKKQTTHPDPGVRSSTRGLTLRGGLAGGWHTSLSIVGVGMASGTLLYYRGIGFLLKSISTAA